MTSHHFLNLEMHWRNLQHPLVTQPRWVGAGQHSLPSFPSLPIPVSITSLDPIPVPLKEGEKTPLRRYLPWPSTSLSLPLLT